MLDTAQHMQYNINTHMSLRSYVTHVDLTLHVLYRVTHTHSSEFFKFLSQAKPTTHHDMTTL